MRRYWLTLNRKVSNMIHAGVDLDSAKRSREHRATPQERAYYAEQAHMAAQWEMGAPPPVGLVLGELLQVSMGAVRHRKGEE